MTAQTSRRADRARPVGDGPVGQGTTPAAPATARDGGTSTATAEPTTPSGRRPLYARLLRLRHLRLRGWQRVLLSDGALLLSVLLVMADLATAWTLLVLPIAVAAVVKLHDVAAGLLAVQTPTAPVPQDRRRREQRED